MSGNERFDYGKAVQANCANCGVVQIPSRVSLNTSCPRCKGVLVLNTVDLHSQRRSTDNREQNLLLQDDNEDLENTTLAPSTEDSAELDTVSLQHLSLATDENLSGLPLQESFEASSSRRKASTYPSKLSKTPTEGNDENGINGVCQTCGDLNSTHECLSCFIAIFKRGVISGKNRSHVVYIIPKEKFDLVFAKIVQNEAAAYEGTEIAVTDDKRNFCYHPQMAIQNELTIIFKMDCGECFALISPASTTLGVQHVLAKSEERIFPGAHVKLVTAYVGEENTLREDKVRMALLSGQARLGILIPTKVHHTPTDVLDGLNYSVTGMPKLDRDALQSCHVDLIENIGDFTSLCAYLYQCNILTADDKAFLSSFPRPSEGIDQLLMMIPRKGNILDIFIRVLQQSRENQEAAKRLVLKRLQLHEKTENK